MISAAYTRLAGSIGVSRGVGEKSFFEIFAFVFTAFLYFLTLSLPKTGKPRLTTWRVTPLEAGKPVVSVHCLLPTSY